MKINQTQSVYIKRQETGTQALSKDNKKQQAKAGKNIYAGSLNLTTDPVAQKRAQAQKRAMKMMSDAFSGETSIDSDVKSRKDHAKQMQEEIGNAQSELNAIEDRKKELAKDYQVAPDSMEQQDLELLEKRRQAKTQGTPVEFTKEEQKRLDAIDENGMSEYQKRSMEIDGEGDPYREQMKQAKQSMAEDNAVVREVKKERLKSSPMLDAQNQAAAVMDAANEEIKGILFDQAKDHIDDQMAEQEEKGEKVSEEKKEKEQQIEEIKEKIQENDQTGQTASSTAPADDLPDTELVKMDQLKDHVQQDVTNMMDKMKLISEDIKGIVVDKVL